MPNLYTLTGDFDDLLGGEAVVQTIRATITTNVEEQGGTLVDTTNKTFRFGGMQFGTYADGTWSISGLVGSNSTDLNVPVDTLEYQVTVRYAAVGGGHTTRALGWFKLNGNANLADVARQMTPTEAQTAADYVAQQAAIAGLTGEDSAVAFLIEDDLTPSQTRAALDNLYGGGGAAGLDDTAIAALVADDDATPSATRGAIDSAVAEEMGQAGSPLRVAADGLYTTPDEVTASIGREQPGGTAGLDAGGLLSSSRIPALPYASVAHRPINVREAYGTTDADIRAAWAAAASTSRSLYLPAGTYTPAGDLLLDKDDVSVDGDGDVTVLAFTDGGVVLDGASTAHALRNRLANFKVTRTGTPGPAVYLKGGGVGTGVARFGIYDVHVAASTGAGFRFDGSYIGAITNCYGRGSNTGLVIDADTVTGVVGGNLLTFTGCEFQSNTKAATIDTTAGVTFVGCGFEGNTTEGVELVDNCRAITFVNPYFEANGGYDIKVGTVTAAIATTIQGGYFAEGGVGKTVSIDCIKAEELRIVNPFFSGYGANSPIRVPASSAVEGRLEGGWSNGTAALVSSAGATRWSTPPTGVLHASQVLDFPSMTAGASANLTITVPGAAVGDDTTVHYNGTPPAGVMPLAWVSSADTVTIRLTNLSSVTVDPPAATMRAIVWKF